MGIDWSVVRSIAIAIITLIAGAWVDRLFESRPTLISHFGHISTFQVNPPGGQRVLVNTHAIVLRNAGRRSATNVRLSHNFLPDFNIWPALQHHVEDVPGGVKEIVIPTLVPSEVVTISYLYFAPVTYAEVNAGIKSDQGFALPIPVLLQRQFPKWFNLLAALLMIIGTVALVYVAVEAVGHVIRIL